LWEASDVSRERIRPPGDVHRREARAAVVEGCLWIHGKTCVTMKVEECLDRVLESRDFAPDVIR